MLVNMAEPVSHSFGKGVTDPRVGAHSTVVACEAYAEPPYALILSPDVTAGLLRPSLTS